VVVERAEPALVILQVLSFALEWGTKKISFWKLQVWREGIDLGIS